MQKTVLYATHTAFDLRPEPSSRRRREKEKEKEAMVKGEKNASLPGWGERERNETSPLKYRVHVRSEHRDVETSPVDTFIRPPLAGLIIYVSSLADFIVGITISANGPSLAEYLTLLISGTM